MNGPTAAMIVPLMIYVAVQTLRDARARHGLMAGWGGVTFLLTLWFLIG